MRNLKNKIGQWIPIIVLLLLAAFAIVRMQTTQAALIKQVETKQDKAVYQADKENLVRELDLIHESLVRIEGKLDNVISGKPKANPGDSGD